MNEEWFDVVNEKDEVIARETRKRVHQAGLKHRAVHILVFNRSGQVFLQKRSRSKDTHPGVWDSSASGHLDCGEDYDSCALRELQEELGWQPPALPRRLFKIPACEETGQEFVWAYACEGEGPFRLHPEEIETGDWFSPDHVTGWIKDSPHDFAPAFICIWRMLKSPTG